MVRFGDSDVSVGDLMHPGGYVNVLSSLDVTGIRFLGDNEVVLLLHCSVYRDGRYDFGVHVTYIADGAVVYARYIMDLWESIVRTRCVGRA